MHSKTNILMNRKFTFTFASLFLFLAFLPLSFSQEHSIARKWNDALLEAIRTDFARPTVHARNLFHTSVALYDAWAIYDEYATTFFLGKTVDGFTCPLDLADIPIPDDIQAAQEEAMSYAAYRLLRRRFLTSPNAFLTLMQFDFLMNELGYDTNITSTDYTTGSPAMLGNYLGQYLIDFGFQDGSNELFGYGNTYYEPVNPPLVTEFPGNPDIVDPNRWQPLTLDVFIDQGGNPLPFNTPDFLSPEWGLVTPFSLTEDDLTIHERDGDEYWVYHDPGMPPMLDTVNGAGTSDFYKWGFELVSIWSSHLDPTDGEMIDISPASIGNIQDYPTSIEDYDQFYDLLEGGDPSVGYDVNPVTGEPYEPQIVPRGDYGRVLAEFWADGPDSETPPGHWFTILNYVNDHPMLEKRFRGEGPIIEDLEWDVKTYFALGGAMHDVAVASWGVKGWYDYIRPISAIRYMADRGQSTDPELPSYHPAGLPLVEGYVEVVMEGDTLAGEANENVGKIKLYAWRGPDYIDNPNTDDAGVGWILAENWWPYQRPSFVTPPFAGYVSGHSTYSRAAAELLTLFTGDEYFPGGMGEFHAPQNEFLVFEEGPSVDLTLQWAKYRDASDQCSLSRIWGGIHPPADDLPGRFMGEAIGIEAFLYAESYFLQDNDEDGYYHNEDCNDEDAAINPGAVEICDNIDNDCNGFVDDDIDVFTYYLDSDGDGYGDANASIDTCATSAIEGYVNNDLDCDDGVEALNPDAVEICDGIDNDCNGFVDDEIDVFTYYLDSDGDGYGDANVTVDTCATSAIEGYVDNDLDCDDGVEALNPDAVEICDGIDNDCNGFVDDDIDVFTYYLDSDGDGFGDANFTVDTCATSAIEGYVDNDLDCDDGVEALNPDAVEICDGIDNNCDGFVDEGLEVITYFEDSDNDGYGNLAATLDTCLTSIPEGFTDNDLDCDDSNPDINPEAMEVLDSLDNDCNGLVDDGLVAVDDPNTIVSKIFPNPTQEMLHLQMEYTGRINLSVVNLNGKRIKSSNLDFVNQTTISLSGLPTGVYLLMATDEEGRRLVMKRVVKI